MEPTYEQKVKTNLLNELESNGYTDGFNFEEVDYDFYDNQSYITAGFDSFNGLVYIPMNTGFHTYFRVTINKDDDDISRVLTYPYTETSEYKDKGLYPGKKYFEKELFKIQQSLQLHKPILKLAHIDYNLAAGLEILSDSQVIVLQVSNETIHCIFKDAHTRASVEFYYNLESGELSDIRTVFPKPVLI